MHIDLCLVSVLLGGLRDGSFTLSTQVVVLELLAIDIESYNRPHKNATTKIGLNVVQVVLQQIQRW